MKTKMKFKQEIIKNVDRMTMIYWKFFNKLDKIWQAEFGKECQEFCPNCAQCKFSLIYNKFKQEVFDEVCKNEISL